MRRSGRENLRRLVRFLAPAFGMALFAASCGQPRTDARLASSDTQPATPPMLIAIDGYNTCKGEGSPNDTRFAPLSRAATQGHKARVILSCFGDTSWNFNLRVSSPTSQDARLRAGIAVASFDEYFAIIRQETEPGEPIVLVGHSHGGWLALQTVLALASTRPVTELVTADAISYNQCTASLMAQSVLGTIFGEPYAGCTQAPPDLASRFRTVRQHLTRWENFFQDDFAFLHSSSVSEAHHNTHLAYNFSGLDAYHAHGSTAVDGKVWGLVRQRLSRYFLKDEGLLLSQRGGDPR